jgi:pimeloyl-ACP methyl ester carboxylesterase
MRSAVELPYERALREWMGERGMRHERVVYARPAAGGDTVAYRLCPAGPPRGLLLVTHGAGNDALFAFPGFFKQVLQRGYEVFTFDMDGHGRASTTVLTYPAVCGAVADALEQALQGRADLPVHAYGVSLGGAILLHALAGPLRGIRSATLVVAPLRIRFSLPKVLNELRPVALRTVLEQREHSGLWGMVPSFGPVKRDLYPLRLSTSRPGAFGYVGVLNEVLERMDLVEAARRGTAPALLAYGARDRIVPAEQGVLLHRTLPRSELLLVRGGTHLATPFDAAVLRRTLEWMEGAAGEAEPEPGTSAIWKIDRGS